MSEASWGFSFLKFIKDFSEAAKSLREFLKRNVTFKFIETVLRIKYRSGRKYLNVRITKTRRHR